MESKIFFPKANLCPKEENVETFFSAINHIHLFLANNNSNKEKKERKLLPNRLETAIRNYMTKEMFFVFYCLISV